MTTTNTFTAACERLRGTAMNPRLGLSNWYQAHEGSDTGHADQQRAFNADMRRVAEVGPELLAACEFILAHECEQTPCMVCAGKARDAIAKAKS